jgi:hypothetical protein
LVPLTENAPAQQNQRKYRSFLGSFLLRLCVAVTLIVAVMSAVELYSYRRYANYGAKDDLEPEVKLDLAESGSAEKLEYWNEFGQANKVEYHQYVLWRRAPYQGAQISIDQDGVRQTLHTHCDSSTSTIWMYGDSVMWGAGVPDAETISSLVAQDYEKAGKPVCVMNYGEKGWSNSQEVVALMEQLKHAARKPDLVLFYDGGTEAFSAYQSGRADVHSNFNSFKNFLDSWGTAHAAGFSYLEQTNTYRLLENIAARMPLRSRRNQTPKPALDTQALSAAVIENYRQNINFVSLMAKQYGFRPVFAFYPNLAAGHKPLTPYEQRVLQLTDKEYPALRSMYQAVYARSREIQSPDFYDLSAVVDNRADTMYVGISHMKAEGDQIVSDRLFQILENKR